MTTDHLDKPGSSADRISPRAAAKIEQILEGARKVFMELGFERASIDEIVRISGVSKPTLYRYFPDKHHLYSAVFTRECERYTTELFPADITGMKVADALDMIGRRYLARLLSPEAQSAFRIAVGDATIFPELARAFFETGPARGARHLEPLLESWVKKRELDVRDIPLAAAQFFELCKADLFYKQVFGVIDRPAPEEIDQVIDGAVTVFMRAYGVEA